MSAYPAPLTPSAMPGLSWESQGFVDDQRLNFPEQLKAPPPALGDSDFRALLKAFPMLEDM